MSQIYSLSYLFTLNSVSHWFSLSKEKDGAGNGDEDEHSAQGNGGQPDVFGERNVVGDAGAGGGAGEAAGPAKKLS